MCTGLLYVHIIYSQQDTSLLTYPYTTARTVIVTRANSIFACVRETRKSIKFSAGGHVV